MRRFRDCKSPVPTLAGLLALLAVVGMMFGPALPCVDDHGACAATTGAADLCSHLESGLDDRDTHGGQGPAGGCMVSCGCTCHLAAVVASALLRDATRSVAPLWTRAGPVHPRAPVHAIFQPPRAAC